MSRHTEAAKMFESGELFGSSTLALITDIFGTECYTWEPETLEIELKDLGISYLDPAMMDRLQAAITLLTSDVAHWDVVAFSNIASALNFDMIDGTSFIPAELDDILWGCAEMKMIEGLEDFKQPFSPEIQEFVKQILMKHGLNEVPEVLNFVTLDKEYTDRSDANLSGDADMFKAYWSTQNDFKKQMTDFLEERYDQLLKQLRELPIEDMDPEFVEAVKEVTSQRSEL
jgi:hypothetical protein